MEMLVCMLLLGILIWGFVSGFDDGQENYD